MNKRTHEASVKSDKPASKEQHTPAKKPKIDAIPDKRNSEEEEEEEEDSDDPHPNFSNYSTFKDGESYIFATYHAVDSDQTDFALIHRDSLTTGQFEELYELLSDVPYMAKYAILAVNGDMWDEYEHERLKELRGAWCRPPEGDCDIKIVAFWSFEDAY